MRHDGVVIPTPPVIPPSGRDLVGGSEIRFSSMREEQRLRIKISRMAQHARRSGRRDTLMRELRQAAEYEQVNIHCEKCKCDCEFPKKQEMAQQITILKTMIAELREGSESCYRSTVAPKAKRLRESNSKDAITIITLITLSAAIAVSVSSESIHCVHQRASCTITNAFKTATAKRISLSFKAQLGEAEILRITKENFSAATNAFGEEEDEKREIIVREESTDHIKVMNDIETQRDVITSQQPDEYTQSNSLEEKLLNENDALVKPNNIQNSQTTESLSFEQPTEEKNQSTSSTEIKTNEEHQQQQQQQQQQVTPTSHENNEVVVANEPQESQLQSVSKTNEEEGAAEIQNDNEISTRGEQIISEVQHTTEKREDTTACLQEMTEVQSDQGEVLTTEQQGTNNSDDYHVLPEEVKADDGMVEQPEELAKPSDAREAPTTEYEGTTEGNAQSEREVIAEQSDPREAPTTEYEGTTEGNAQSEREVIAEQSDPREAPTTEYEGTTEGNAQSEREVIAEQSDPREAPTPELEGTTEGNAQSDKPTPPTTTTTTTNKEVAEDQSDTREMPTTENQHSEARHGDNLFHKVHEADKRTVATDQRDKQEQNENPFGKMTTVEHQCHAQIIQNDNKGGFLRSLRELGDDIGDEEQTDIVKTNLTSAADGTVVVTIDLIAPEPKVFSGGLMLPERCSITSLNSRKESVTYSAQVPFPRLCNSDSDSDDVKSIGIERQTTVPAYHLQCSLRDSK